jgi:dihydroxyacetone kinase-like protein
MELSMADTLDGACIRAMLIAAGAQIRAHHEMLSRLDGAIGDGDHGATILRAMEAAEKVVTEHPGAHLQELLAKVAWAVMNCDGGSTGPLLGSWFLGMSEAAAGKHALNQTEVVALFEAGVLKLAKQSRAKVGDKTMMDAFLPALERMKTAPESSLKELFRHAAEAAGQGAENTKAMRAKFGRARNLGDRVIGHPDPGAVSVSLIFKGFYEGMAAT